MTSLVVAAWLFIFCISHRGLLQHKALGRLYQAASTCQLPVGCLRRDLLCVCDLLPANTGRWEAVEEVKGYVGKAGKVVGFPGFSSLGRPNPSEGLAGENI